MDSPIQDDPYEALGVTKLSSAGDIKTAYRKLVLKSHPDKFPDPATKQQKADEFHKIQQAYEILNDEEKRSRYDARVRLAELKAEMLKREGGRDSASKSSRYERPSAATYPSFSRTSTATYEVRTPRFTDEFYDEPKSATRRNDPSAAYYRRSSSPRVKPERERRVEREDKSRSERRRARDEQVREARDRKYHSSPTDDINERAKYEEDRKRRDDVVKQKEEEARRFMKMEESRREEARKVKTMYENQRAAATSYDIKLEDARRYQAKATAEQTYTTSRPPMERRSSAQHYDVRRSRARTSERRRSPDIVEERAPPSFQKSATTSEMLREMAGERGMPIRSHSHNVSSQDREYPPPPAQMRRADTMPAKASSSSRGVKESSRSAKLRQPETLQPDSGYSSSSPTTPEAKHPYISGHHPDIPPANINMSTASVNRTTQFHYPSSGGTTERIAISTSPDKYAFSPSYKTEIRSPIPDRGRDKDRERRRERERPPMATARTVPAPSGDHIPYAHVRAPTYSHRSPDAERERDRVRAAERDGRRSEKSREMEYAELPSDYTRRNNLQPKSYKDNEINIGKRFDYEDIAFSSSGRSRGRDDSYVRKPRYSGEKERYDRPSMPMRSTTFAFG